MTDNKNDIPTNKNKKTKQTNRKRKKSHTGTHTHSHAHAHTHTHTHTHTHACIGFRKSQLVLVCQISFNPTLRPDNYDLMLIPVPVSLSPLE